MNVKDKVILITGGAGGLGSALAKLLSEKGADVYILDLDQQRGREITEEIIKNRGSPF